MSKAKIQKGAENKRRGKKDKRKGKGIENNILSLNNNINIYFNISMNCLKCITSHFLFPRKDMGELKHI